MMNDRSMPKPPARTGGQDPAHGAEHGLGQRYRTELTLANVRARRGREPAEQGTGEQHALQIDHEQ